MRQMKKMENKEKSTEKSTDKRLKNLRPPFKKGQSGNPKGYPKGQRNFLTIYKEALLNLAKKNRMTPKQLEDEIVESGILQARRGNYSYYRDFQDRVHGMPNQSIDVTTGGKELPAPIIRVTRK